MTKIDIFSGFLGAGKTTLIKKLIKEAYQGQNTVLIENEFGEIGVDGAFLQDAGINITEMNSGCICCSLVGDFTKALEKVIDEYHPDRIVIEPSGVGKLSDVTKAVSKVLSDSVAINVKCAVADANKCKMYMKNFGEFYNDQIKEATAIVLSHTKGASDKKIQDAINLIRSVNGTATVITTDWDKLSGKDILSAMESGQTVENELKALEKETHHHAHHHHHDHSHDEDCTCGCQDHEHGHHHHHDHGHDEDCICGCQDHEHGHHHHHDHGHDEDCTCGCQDHEHGHHHDHDHGHDEHCTCGCHDHHHHHADEVFSSVGVETAKKFTKEELENIFEIFIEDDSYGMILRAKGVVESTEGCWLHFDYVPGEGDVREGGADVCGKLCVIGSGIDAEKIKDLFGVN